MKQFGTMLSFELKKIYSKKMTWITLAALFLLGIFMAVGRVVFFIPYDEIAAESERARALNGSVINDALLADLQKSRAAGSEEMNAIYDIVWTISDGNAELAAAMDEETLYGEWEKLTLTNAENMYCSDVEVEYWKKRMQEVRTPFVYEYGEGYGEFLSIIYSLNIYLFLAVTICLSGVFSEEHVRRTDALILCSRNGKHGLYLAKILAGIIFAFSSTVITIGLSLLGTLIIYGFDGFGAMMQTAGHICAWPVTVGQAVLILILLQLAAAVFYSICVMFLSEWFKNGVAVMSVMTVFMMVCRLVEVPFSWRVISQILYLMPFNLIAGWSFFDCRTVPVFGYCLTNFQTGAVLYALISVLLFCLGKWIYKRYQVTGR